VTRRSRLDLAWLVAASLGFGGLGGCGGHDAAPAATPPPTAPRDAGAGAGATGVTVVPGFDPASGMHLDDDAPARPAWHPPAVPRGGGRRLELVLRSTPSGAIAAVDGVEIGTTPTFWAGEFTGREHEFTFVLASHAVARYRFVPITSGIVHARLEKITDDDGGVPEIPRPELPPEPPPPPPPPPDARPAPAPAPVAVDAALVVDAVPAPDVAPAPSAAPDAATVNRLENPF
jgi:hypothetical protein